MSFLCPSTPIVSVIFLIELRLFCFLNLHLAMILAEVNFMLWLHTSYVLSGYAPLRSSLGWNSGHWDKPPYLAFHFHHRSFFFLLFLILTSLNRLLCSQSGCVFLEYCFYWQLSLVPLFLWYGRDKALDANQLLYIGDTTFLWQIFD